MRFCFKTAEICACGFGRSSHWSQVFRGNRKAPPLVFAGFTFRRRAGRVFLFKDAPSRERNLAHRSTRLGRFVPHSIPPGHGAMPDRVPRLSENRPNRERKVRKPTTFLDLPSPSHFQGQSRNPETLKEPPKRTTCNSWTWLFTPEQSFSDTKGPPEPLHVGG